jgi:dolichol kinase
MTDLGWLAIWSLVLASGVAACVVVHAAGVATTYVRDMLHVGAGVWVLGWLWWDGVAIPVAIVAMVAIVVAAVPLLAPRIELVARFRRSVSGGDEGWAGLVFYTISFVILTAVGLSGERFPAAAGLLALTFGDGLGGAVGRQLGHLRYRWPWAKPKTVEGSMTVAAGACLGVVVAAGLFDASIAPTTVLAIGVIAAVAEGLAPRSSDNVLVPAAVWTAATLFT